MRGGQIDRRGRKEEKENTQIVKRKLCISKTVSKSKRGGEGIN